MSPITIQRLNRLNADFYAQIGKLWNNSDGYFWEGWNILYDRYHRFQFQSSTQPSQPKIRVLDLGCGNGRLSDFLVSKSTESQSSYEYTGLDSSEFLLQQAEARRQAQLASFSLIQADLTSADWPAILRNTFKTEVNPEYDLICLFGVMHHIPGFETRLDCLQQARRLLAPGGELIFTTWQYLDLPRLRKRVVDLESSAGQALLLQLKVQADELEPGDHLLDWVKSETAYRYSHYFSKAEAQTIISAAGFVTAVEFLADGRHDDTNQYWVCRNF